MSAERRDGRGGEGLPEDLSLSSVIAIQHWLDSPSLYEIYMYKCIEGV